MENDYAIGDRKFGGNAQYLCKGRWLHHSSLLWDYQPERMNCLLFPQKTPKYRQNRSHDDFLCRLSEVHPCRKEFLQQLVDGLNGLFSVERRVLEDVQKILQVSHRKATVLVQ